VFLQAPAEVEFEINSLDRYTGHLILCLHHTGVLEIAHQGIAALDPISSKEIALEEVIVDSLR
jgi:hypothetical protein